MNSGQWELHCMMVCHKFEDNKLKVWHQSLWYSEEKQRVVGTVGKLNRVYRSENHTGAKPEYLLEVLPAWEVVGKISLAISAHYELCIGAICKGISCSVYVPEGVSLSVPNEYAIKRNTFFSLTVQASKQNILAVLPTLMVPVPNLSLKCACLLKVFTTLWKQVP